MATHTVHTPEPGSHDKVGAVQFTNGAAQVDEVTHEAELRYFRAAGYTVVENEPEEPVVADIDGDGAVEELPKKSASTEVWRAFAVEHGMPEDEANSKSRDELAAHYYQEAGQ
jgi:hypothetical protein